ncbi:N-acetylmuramoyl-L-alanine amidase [Anaeroselena agilis]|uniref:N-acetylmuramoyl-L-alanine amidase n=1 Tax=Anaeroselena agilis TaxID=3063788 RepID=A0ABU3P0T4_9FIRM|nr:N-acetylmuramoyl-L-alanine amidase [Selenomonadales bacterium 4137-cl]
MWLVSLRRRSLGVAAVIGVAAAVAVNLLTANFPGPEEVGDADLAALAGRVVAIDPGHGGVDSGAKYHGLVEKELTLAISLRLAETLRQNGATVVLTREADIDYYTRGKGGKRSDLCRRVEMINSSGAAVFVSIHTNAIRGGRWSGAEVYYCPGKDENKMLAETMQQALKNFPPGNKRQAKEDSRILVLKDTTIPGVLVETGFLSNPGEAALLADPAYQQKLAGQIARALAYHFSHNVAR